MSQDAHPSRINASIARVVTDADVNQISEVPVSSAANFSPAVRPGLLVDLKRLSPAVLTQIQAPISADSQTNLPDSQTQNGNLFSDRFDPNLHWFLPNLSLGADLDPQFSFTASQIGIDANSNPFHKVRLQLSLQQGMPADVVTFKANNPAAELRPIPFHNLTVTLSTTYKDDSGNDQHGSFVGALSASSDGSLQVTFDNILGNNVLILYTNLLQGGAQIAITAVYDVWVRATIISRLPHPLPIKRFPSGVSPVPRWISSDAMTHSVDTSEVRVASNQSLLPRDASSMVSRPIEDMPIKRIPIDRIPIDRIPIDRIPIDDGNDFPDNTPTITYYQSTATFSWEIALNQKYAVNGYQLKYTVTENGQTQAIVNINDLKSFNVRQSEFMELKVLGNFSQRYPSLSKLYIGTLSRTIVVIPSEYVIAREVTHCDAVCIALVDTSPVGASRCKFQFKFLLMPNVNPIELLQLSQEISHYPDLKDYTLKLPESLNSAVPSTISTLFQSSSGFTGAALPHCFSLDINVTDQSLDSPAIANANLLIKQLSSAQEPYLSGTVGLKLDDYYPAPVITNAILNFKTSVGTNDVVCRIDESAQTITLTNQSVFDLLISRYALCTNQGATVVPLNPPAPVKSGQSLTIPLPADHTGLTVLTDSAIDRTSTIARSALSSYLQFLQQDVQNLQYTLGINASGVNFDSRGIDTLNVQISLPDLPDIAVPVLSMYQLHKAANTNLLLPLQYAVTSLNATLLFTVSFKDVNKPAIQFTKQNDFVDRPIFVLQDSDLAITG